MSHSRIIILGGGFSGIACARTLRSLLPQDRYPIVLFNRENHMVFQPLLAEVVGASLDPGTVAAPIRKLLKGVFCRTEEVKAVHPDRNQIEYLNPDGQPQWMDYSNLVLACGSSVNMSMVPGMADHSFPLRTVGDAFALRSHVMQQLEQAEVCSSPERRRWYLSFIIVGGGFSGVEVAGEINDLVRGSHRYFAHIKNEDIQVTLIHSRNQILPEVTENLREFARQCMEKAGIQMRLDERVALATPEGVGLQSGRMIKGATVVCTIGNSISPLIEKLDVEKDRGRPATDLDMRVKGYENLWAIGDCSHIINAYDQKPCPTTGQFAERQGKQSAENIFRVISKQPTRPFHFKPLGQLCAIGGHNAVAELMGFKLSGFPAWWMWRTVYLMKLPSLARKVKVALDWTWELFFSRDLVHLKVDRTSRISHAFYQPGDYIFRQGETGVDFYIVEKGEVEVIHEDPKEGREKVLAIVGTGDFFGEMALMEKRPRTASVRARTPVEVVVMGGQVFNQVSSSLAPLRDLLVRSIQRRQKIWKFLPQAEEVLERIPLQRVIEPMPEKPFDEKDSFGKAIQLFSRKQLDFCCVVDAEQRLTGIMTRTDLLRAIDRTCSPDDATCTRTLIHEVMVPKPIVVSTRDSCVFVINAMQERGLSKLPVVDNRDSMRLVGYIRIEKIMSEILDQLPKAATKKPARKK